MEPGHIGWVQKSICGIDGKMLLIVRCERAALLFPRKEKPKGNDSPAAFPWAGLEDGVRATARFRAGQRGGSCCDFPL